jgi:hypothetical protein
MKLLRKCVILLKMIMTEGPNTGSFVKRAHSTKMNGTMIFIIVPLLLMMLLPWQQNCRLSHGHNPTSHPVTHVRWALGPKAILDEIWGNNIVIMRQRDCHGKVLRHGSPQCGSDMIFFSSIRDNHVMAEAQEHVGYQFSRLSDEASHNLGLVPVHTRPWGILAGVCPKVLATKSTSAHSAQWNCHWGHDQGSSARTYGPILRQETPQTLEKLLQKMDEYIRADNDFRQKREEAYRFSEMTRGFGGRIHPRHVRSIHSSSQNDDKGSQL